MKKKRTVKKKTIKKLKYWGKNIALIILLIIIILVIFNSLKYIVQITPTTTTLPTTTITTSTTTTTIPTIQTCDNFTWNIDDVDEFDIKGNYRIIVVDFTVQYVGTEVIDYGWAGSHRFKILDDGGKYYNTQETYIYCPSTRKFEIGIVHSGYKTSGCLEFRILDENEPAKLVFYDYIIHTMCQIDLS